MMTTIELRFSTLRGFHSAFALIVEERATAEAHARHSDAVNGLQLVAPPAVLRALDAFVAYNSFRNPDKDIERHNQLLGALIKAMRQDLQPAYKGEDKGLEFRLLGVPPQE